MNWFYKLFDHTKCKRKFNPTNFAGAGNVNWWGRSDPRKETKKLAKYGIPCYHIELMGWAETHGFNHWGDVSKKLKELLFWCKRRKIVLFVSVVNDNSHLAKYGNTPISINAHRGVITQALFNLAKATKKQKVYIQPTGETQTSAGRWVEEEAARLIDKRFLVCNTNSRPQSVPAWASFIAYHKARITDGAPRGCWDVTDHGTLLNWLGGTSAQTYNNDRIIDWVGTAKKNDSPAILYMFQQKVMDESNLKALARAFY